MADVVEWRALKVTDALKNIVKSYGKIKGAFGNRNSFLKSADDPAVLLYHLETMEDLIVQLKKGLKKYRRENGL